MDGRPLGAFASTPAVDTLTRVIWADAGTAAQRQHSAAKDTRNIDPPWQGGIAGGSADVIREGRTRLEAKRNGRVLSDSAVLPDEKGAIAATGSRRRRSPDRSACPSGRATGSR